MGSRVHVRALVRGGLLATLSLALPLSATAAWAGGPTTVAPPTEASGQEQSKVEGTPRLTVAQQRATASKDAAAARALTQSRRAVRAMRASGDDGTGPVDPAPVIPVHKSLKVIKQKAQVRTYWCGPATLATLVQANGASISETTAAKRLKTNRNGTNWYAGAGNYPMETALEHYSKGFDYTAANLPYTPTDDDVATFKERLVTDVAVNKQGIAGNAYEVRNGPHLNGHPNRTIFHWIAVRGYDDSGDTTRYADPVAGSSISWAGPVPAYNEIATDKIVTIFGARGYVW